MGEKKSEKITKVHNIYLIDKEKVKEAFAECTESENIIQYLISSGKGYKEQKLKESFNPHNLNIKFYFKDEYKDTSAISSFCSVFVDEDEDVLKYKPRFSSSVMFVWGEKYLFAITTGQGYRIISDFCVQKFGMLILNNFKDSFKVTALDSNEISSSVHSSKTIFTNEIDFFNIDDLDIVIKEVTGKISDTKSIQELLMLDEKSKKKNMKVTAKDFLKISNALDIGGLLNVLRIISKYNLENLKDDFNLIVPLKGKSKEQEISTNNKKVASSIYNTIYGDEKWNFDLFSHDTMSFIEADEFKIFGNTRREALLEAYDIEPVKLISEAYKVYLGGKEPNEDSFETFLTSATLKSVKDDGIVTSGKLMRHISGEINTQKGSYYMFYGNYYFLDTSYTDRLNESLVGKLKVDRYTKEIKTKWDSDEDDFNKNASLEGDYIHLHKVKPENIEFADLLKIDKDRITVVHVKDNFDGDMRVLDRQVELSILKILDARKNNNVEYFKKLYKNASKSKVGINIKDRYKDEDDFIKAIKNAEEVNFIVVIRPKTNDLLDSPSNIAKHCLNALILRCFNKGIDLKINLIKRNS